jgi:(p)ppGpp synthase/HD superfamily hydrolase
MPTVATVATEHTVLKRIPCAMTLQELSRRLHCSKMSNEELGGISRMQHTVSVRYAHVKRKSGAPAHVHFYVVQYLLAELDFGPVAEQIGLGHDLIEDVVMTYDEVASSFGRRVTQGISGLSKHPTEHKGRPDLYYAQINRCAQAGLWEVPTAKLADRGHNLRTLRAFANPEKEASYLRETQDYVWPLIHSGREAVNRFAPDRLDSYDRLVTLLRREFVLQSRRLGVEL